jgi:serine/threonine-protein kinase RsbW
MIRLSVPGRLAYRGLVLRVIASSCKLLSPSPTREPGDDEFVDKVVSAVGEAFNNVAVHAYANQSGNVELEISADERALTIRMSDTGSSFDPSAVPEPDLPSLPERSMGLYIIRSFMDEVAYVPGSSTDGPNALTLSRRFFR